MAPNDLARQLTLRWLGVAGVELAVGGDRSSVLVIDPFVTRFPIRKMRFGRVAPDGDAVQRHVPRADHLIVTHAHWDHLLDAPEVARQTGCQVMGSRNTLRILHACGVPTGRTRNIAPGDDLELGPFSVRVIEGQHLRFLGQPIMAGELSADLRPPLRAHDYRMDDSLALLFRASTNNGSEPVRILHWMSMRTDNAPRADILFVKPFHPMGYYHQLIEAVRPRVIVPIHYDLMTRPVVRRRFDVRRRRICQRETPAILRLAVRRLARVVRHEYPHTRLIELERFAQYPVSGLLEQQEKTGRSP